MAKKKHITEELADKKLESKVTRAFLLELGYKYCPGAEEVLPIADFYELNSKGKTTYTTLSKPYHQAQLKDLREGRKAGTRNPKVKQVSLLELIEDESL